ncbi:MAG TPA: acyl-CoA thioesterase [Actinomycetales bacterium]|jgi:acyl-CoA thioester hydrolase
MAHYRCDYPMRWSDMDAYGHVNNVQYLRFFEDARIEAFGAHRPHEDGGSMLDTGILVVRHEIEYLKPLRWRPEPVHIDLWITTLKGAKIEVGYEVYDEPPGAERVRYAVAESTLVLYDLANERPKRLQEKDIERLDGLRGGPVPFRGRRGRPA